MDAADEVAVPEDVCEFPDEPVSVTLEPPEPTGVIVVV